MSKQPEALRLADTLEHEYKFLVVEGSDGNGKRVVVDANIDSAILELRRLHEVNRELVEALERARDWFESQAKAVSKGYRSPFELMMLRDERDAAQEAIAKATGESNE